MVDFKNRHTFTCFILRVGISLCILSLLLSACNSPSRPVKVQSTWRFETIFSSKQFSDAGPHWLAMDSMGYPHLAYGGNALYYAWFDGKAWHYDTASSENGSGKYPDLILDSNNSPHIIHAKGLVGKMTLVHTFRDQTGWRSENIDANFCGGRDLNAQLDPRGKLTLVYSDGGPDCNDQSVASSRIQFIQQAAGGWETQTVAQPGLSPSLAFDGLGRTLISYVDAVLGNLNLAVRENGIWTIHQVDKGIGIGGLTTSLVIDSGSWVHIFYTHETISTDESTVKLEHAWQDNSGWQFETLLTVPNASPQVSAYIDTQGGIYVLYLDRELKLLRHEVDGWHVTPIPGNGDNYNSPTLALDRQGQLAIAYIDVLNYSIVYDVQNEETWEAIVIDRGDDLSGSKAALAFGPGGELRAAFYSQRGVNYAWKEGEIWKDELVISRQSSDWFLDEPIELLVDPQNQAHIFYNLTPEATNGLMYALQVPTGWVRESVPVDLNWSRPVISPEGWPVIFDNSAQDSSNLFYRTTQGWQDKYLEGMQNGVAAIGYSSAQAPSTDGNLSLPYILFYGGVSNTMTLRNPAQNTDIVLPAVGSDRIIKEFTLGFESPDKPVVLVFVDQKKRAGDITAGVLYITLETSGWKSYEKIDNMVPLFPVTPSDKNGDTHYVVESGNGENDARTFYLVGNGSHWKITPVGGVVLTPGTNLIGAALYAKTGGFCALFLDMQANAIHLGCLESIK